MNEPSILFDRRSLLLPLTLLLIFGVGGCSQLGVNESLEWHPLPGFAEVARVGTGWRDVRGDETFRTVFLRSTDTIAKWKIELQSLELPMAITLTNAFHWNPQSVMGWLKADAEKRGCGTDHWTVLEQDARA